MFMPRPSGYWGAVNLTFQSGKTNTIGLIVADISNPFFSSIARIIEDEAMRQGYVVIDDKNHITVLNQKALAKMCEMTLFA